MRCGRVSVCLCGEANAEAEPAKRRGKPESSRPWGNAGSAKCAKIYHWVAGGTREHFIGMNKRETGGRAGQNLGVANGDWTKRNGAT